MYSAQYWHRQARDLHRASSERQIQVEDAHKRILQLEEQTRETLRQNAAFRQELLAQSPFEPHLLADDVICERFDRLTDQLKQWVAVSFRKTSLQPLTSLEESQVSMVSSVCPHYADLLGGHHLSRGQLCLALVFHMLGHILGDRQFPGLPKDSELITITAAARLLQRKTCLELSNESPLTFNQSKATLRLMNGGPRHLHS